MGKCFSVRGCAGRTHPCSGYHVDRNYLTETGRMKKGALGSVSLDRILSNELEELYPSDIFRLCLLVSLKDSRFFFKEGCYSI